MGRLTVVGSGTVVPESDRGCSAYAVELGRRRVLLDCGPGTVQGLVRHGVPWERLSDLVLTHFHADHVGALPGLFFALKHGTRASRADPLHVWGPEGTSALFEGLASTLGDYFLDPGFPVEVRELSDDGEILLGDTLHLSTTPTPHTEESRAVRLRAGETVLGYTGDTGPSAAVADFMEGADALICECALLDGEVGDNHLSPARVAALAGRANPELLLLTHIYPHVRREHDVAALVAAAGWSGATRVLSDGDDFRL